MIFKLSIIEALEDYSLPKKTGTTNILQNASLVTKTLHLKARKTVTWMCRFWTCANVWQKTVQYAKYVAVCKIQCYTCNINITWGMTTSVEISCRMKYYARSKPHHNMKNTMLRWTSTSYASGIFAVNCKWEYISVWIGYLLYPCLLCYRHSPTFLQVFMI